MSKHWRILGISLLALIGVLAVNASAAHAEKWLLLVGGKSVTLIKITGESKEEGFLLSGNGSKIKCKKSQGSAEAKLSTDKKLLGGTATVTFEECKDEGFSGTCTVRSAGQAAGTIVAKGEGDVEMEKGGSDETVWIKAVGSGGKFTEVIYEGIKCPLNEAEEPVSGTAKITILKALEPLTSREIHIVGEGLKLGATEAKLHMLKEGKELPEINGTIKEATGATFALHLCDLPGTPVCGP